MYRMIRVEQAAEETDNIGLESRLRFRDISHKAHLALQAVIRTTYLQSSVVGLHKLMPG